MMLQGCLRCHTFWEEGLLFFGAARRRAALFPVSNDCFSIIFSKTDTIRTIPGQFIDYKGKSLSHFLSTAGTIETYAGVTAWFHYTFTVPPTSPDLFGPVSPPCSPAARRPASHRPRRLNRDRPGCRAAPPRRLNSARRLRISTPPGCPAPQ